MTDPAPIGTALILAAGQGSRMGALGAHHPKAALPVLGTPLIVRHLRRLAENGVRRAVVVVGHLGEAIRAAVAAHPVPGLEVAFREQAERLGLGHAVLHAEDALGGEPFVLILGDIDYAMRGAALFALPPGVDALVAVKHEPDDDAIRRNFSVELAGGRRIARVVEKPVHLPNRLKGTGQYAFSPAIHDAIRATPRSALKNEHELTDAIQTLIDRGGTALAVDTVTWDVNLTVPADLLACNLHHLREGGHDCLAEDSLPGGVQATESVVGCGVRFDGRAELRRVVVLDGSRIAAGAMLEDCVVSPNGIWRTGDG